MAVTPTDNNDIDLAPSKPPFWYNPKFRALLFQILLFLALAALFGFIINNTLNNLEDRGINTGFAFLGNEAGFGILQTLIPYDETNTYGRTFIVGLLNTILVSVMGIILATILGFIVGIARLSPNWLVAKLAAVYIEIFRNVPVLLQIFFWYIAVLRALPNPRQSWDLYDLIFLNVRGLYIPKPVLEEGFGLVLIALAVALSSVLILRHWAKRRHHRTGQPFPTLWLSLGVLITLPGVAFWLTGTPLSWELPVLKGFNFRGGIVMIPELTALWLALSIYTSTFIAEIIRAGIQGVDHGQTEAAYALGLRRGQNLKLVVIPQAMRIIIPMLNSQYMTLTKNSSLATAIGYPDLVSVFAGSTLNLVGQAVEIMAMTMGVYLLMNLLMSLLMNWYNSRVQLVER